MKKNHYLNKDRTKKSKLFLICPVSHMEPFIKYRYGCDGYFLTAPGAVFNIQEIDYSEALKDFLERNAIQEIFIVNDTSCRFIKSTVEREQGYETKAEQVLLNLFIDHYSQIMEVATPAERKIRLAKLNIQRQALDLFSNELLLPVLERSKIRVTGLLTTKQQGRWREVDVMLHEKHQ